MIFILAIETHNNIRTVHSESSVVKLTRFEIEGWLELIGTPSVNILQWSDYAWPCCLLSQWISNHGFGTISNSRCYGRILTPWLNDTVFTTDRGAGNQANLICFRAVGIFLTDIDTPLSYRNFNLIKGPSIY